MDNLSLSYGKKTFVCFLCFTVKSYKRTGRYAVCRYAPRPLDLCHVIGLRPPFLALRALTWPFASIVACGLNFRPFGPHLGLRPRYTALHAAYYAAALPLVIKMLMMRHHGDDVYMTSQPIVVQTATPLF